MFCDLGHPQKREVNRKKGEFLKLFCLRVRENDWEVNGKERGNEKWEGTVYLGNQGYWETIQSNYKINFIQDSCHILPQHFKSTIH